MPVVAGVDVGNATTEVAVVETGGAMAGAAAASAAGAISRAGAVAGGRLLGVDRLPTRGRKGSPESLRGAASLVRRLERRLGCRVDEARVAPLRAVDTTILAIPHVAPPTGRLRLLAAGVATPGGGGACVGVPLWLDRPLPAAAVAPVGDTTLGAGTAQEAGVAPAAVAPVAAGGFVAVVPPGLGYARAAERLRDLAGAGVPVAAVLVAGDEGVLVANRLAARIPVIDQVDVAGVVACSLVAVEVRAPGQPLTLLADPVALGAALALADGEAGDAVTLCRALVDYSNAVVGRAEAGAADAGTAVTGTASTGTAGTGTAGTGTAGTADGPGAGPEPAAGAGRPGPSGTAGPWVMAAGPWVMAGGERVALREACARLPGWPVGTVHAFSAAPGSAEVDDLFALDLAAVGDTATARRGSLGRAVVVASLQRLAGGSDHAGQLSELLSRPVRCVLTEPGAARLGALTTPGARPDAAVVDVGAGTIDVITPGAEVVAAGAGELLTAAVAETLGIPRAAAEWVKRGPCLRVDGGQRFEAEDGGRGFLDRPAPASAAGTLAVMGPAGLLPFDRRHSPAEWRAVRLRLKQAVF